MVLHSTAKRVRDRGPVLPREGEIEFGARGRRRRQRNIAVALLGVGLIGGAVWLYWALLPHDKAALDGKVPVKVQCASCGYVGEQRIRQGQTFPITCPKCGQRTAKQLWRCGKCKHEFVPPSQAGPYRCPRCGSQSVGSAVSPGP